MCKDIVYPKEKLTQSLDQIQQHICSVWRVFWLQHNQVFLDRQDGGESRVLGDSASGPTTLLLFTMLGFDYEI